MIDLTNGFPHATVPGWVKNAATLPIAFAQVREDPLLDLAIIGRLPPPVRVLMVASGGCTAAALTAHSAVTELHLVDINPAQLHLARLKVKLLHAFPPQERLQLLGHAQMDSSLRRAKLENICRDLRISLDLLGDPALVSEEGLDHVGRYEYLFAQLRQELAPYRQELEALLSLSDPHEQARRVDPSTGLGQALHEAFENVMALPNLITLFGDAATQNRTQAFGSHFLQRTRHVLGTLPAATNPYLAQLFLGRFLGDQLYPWLEIPPPIQLPQVSYTHAPMVEVLAQSHAQYDFVHLSNILDWLNPAEAGDLLAHAAVALRPQGQVIIRQLNSSINIGSLGSGFEWNFALAKDLHHRDRSFFYRNLYIGEKK